MKPNARCPVPALDEEHLENSCGYVTALMSHCGLSMQKGPGEDPSWNESGHGCADVKRGPRPRGGRSGSQEVQKSSSFGSETKTAQVGPWRGVAHGRARTLVKRKPVLTLGGSGSGERVCVAGPPPGIIKNACQMQPAACASCRLGGVRIVWCTALRVHASCHPPEVVA